MNKLNADIKQRAKRVVENGGFMSEQDKLDAQKASWDAENEEEKTQVNKTEFCNDPYCSHFDKPMDPPNKIRSYPSCYGLTLADNIADALTILITERDRLNKQIRVLIEETITKLTAAEAANIAYAETYSK